MVHQGLVDRAVTAPYKISVILIVLNGETTIAPCLQSVSWAAEIIVVDSGSTDRTEEICTTYPGVRFFHHPWLGYGPQKNYALSLATHEWVLSIDADEVITPELAEEIRGAIDNSGAYAGFSFRRKNMYKKQWVRHSGWWPDEILRVFRKDAGRFNDRQVHESVEVNGAVKKLAGVMEHFSYNRPEDFILKMHSYSTAGARQMKVAGKKGGALRAVIRTVAAFVKSYILKRGFLDGRTGLLVAVSGAIGVFYKIIMLSELNEED